MPVSCVRQSLFSTYTVTALYKKPLGKVLNNLELRFKNIKTLKNQQIKTGQTACFTTTLAYKLDYPNNDNAVCGSWLAWANIAEEVCDKICCLVSSAVSEAKSTS